MLSGVVLNIIWSYAQYYNSRISQEHPVPIQELSESYT